MFEQGAPVRELVACRERLEAAVSAPTGLDDRERVDAVRALEELVCTATAAQAHLAAELDASQRRQHATAGEPRDREGRGVAAQVALARRESHQRGRQHLGLATVLPTELPHTWSAWRAGRITEWTATVVARETACLTRQDRAAVDAAVAGDADRLERSGVRQVAEACRAEAARLDPGAVVARRRRAERERHVSLRPAPDTMTWLTALLPVRDGVAVLAALTRTADSARAAGDDRGRGQMMADALVASVLSTTARRDHDTARWDPMPGGQPPPTRPDLQLHLVMTDQALFGTSEAAAHLDGFGDVPAELAREWLVGACTRTEKVWLRRLFTAPSSGELLATDSSARLFPPALGRFVRLRDRHCRTPWCEAPIRHVDHVVGEEEGGPTSAANGQGLCEACNHAKQALGWRARPSPGDDPVIATSTPTGHVHRSPPRAAVRLHERSISVDYVLAG